MMYRRRRATRDGFPATGWGTSLFGGPWNQRGVDGGAPGGYNYNYNSGNVAAPQPTYDPKGNVPRPPV
jgi:hypothetical protein